MRKTVEEFAEFFDEWADEYDEANDNELIRASRSLVVEHAAPGADDTVVDLGTGTGAVAVALADDSARVVGRDVSERMLERAREKAARRGIENVEFGEGRFRDPRVEDADIVVSNFAMHHLGDGEKREAIEAIVALDPRRLVIGDCMFFGETNPDDPVYSEETIDPATVGHLADVLTDVGFALTAVEMVHEQVGVVVAERTERA